MITTILTKHKGWFLGPIAIVFGFIMNAIYEFFSLFGIHNMALCIILFTFITKALMLPLNIKQQKFTKLSAQMNPELQKIQTKYKGKKDEVSLRKQQEETSAVYSKYGANPMAGCLPTLILFPIIFALYRVINNIPAYVSDVKLVYENIALAIQGCEGYKDIILDMGSKIAVNVKGFTETAGDVISTDHIIDVLAKFNTTQWAELKEAFPAIEDIITTNSAEIMRTNSLFGVLNIANNPGWKFPGILVPIIAAAGAFVQNKTISSTSKNNQKKEDNPTMNTMNSLNTIMPIMSGVFCIMMPIGIGLYWIAGSVFSIIQQILVNKYMDKIDVNDIIEKNLAKAVKKGKARPSATGNTVGQLAKTQTKNISNESSASQEKAQTNYQPSNYNKSQVSKGSGSISDIANMLKNNNIDRGGK